MQNNKDKNIDIDFEPAMERLEEIVVSLEDGESLDNSLKLYEEGIKLSHNCFGKLNSVEKKVKELSKNAEGLFELVDAEIEGEN